MRSSKQTAGSSVKVDALFTTPHLGADLARALAPMGVVLRLQASLQALMSLAPAELGEAVVVEDDGRHLPEWLPALCARGPVAGPVVVVGPGDAASIARAIQAGASDYASHHEGPVALWARLSARLELLAQCQPVKRLEVGAYVLDTDKRRLLHGDLALPLTTREFRVLHTLAQRPNEIVDASTLCMAVCRRSEELGKRALEQSIYCLRRKLSDFQESFGASGRLIIATVHAAGYRLLIDEAPVPQKVPRTRIEMALEFHLPEGRLSETTEDADRSCASQLD